MKANRITMDRLKADIEQLIKSKPILIYRVPTGGSMSIRDNYIREFKKEMKDYHVIMMVGNYSDFEFEVLNPSSAKQYRTNYLNSDTGILKTIRKELNRPKP